MEASEANGHIILLMGPMGSGKGTLVKHVKERFPELQFAVSCTTRDKRPNETDGVDYHYISMEQFDNKISNHDFLEWAEFSGNKYGTLKSEIIDRMKSGQVILNEIELQGIKQLIEIIPEKNRTLVYLEAGEWEALKSRALARAPISDEHLELRYQRYLEEVKMKPYADIVIENKDGDFDQAKQEFADVVEEIFNSIEK